MKNDTYSFLPEIPDPSANSQPDQLTDAVYMLVNRLEKSEKKRKKMEVKVDKLLSQDKKKKKSKKKSGNKKKKGKGKSGGNKGKASMVDGLIQESASTALKIVEMYAASVFSTNTDKTK